MAAAGEPTTAGKRKNRVVVWAGGGGGGGGLLLLGGALAATAALGVAFIVRAATKRKTEKAKGSLQEAEGEKKGSDTTCSSEGRAEEGEERGGLSSLLPPPPPQASPQPPPPPKEEESSSLKREQTLTGANPSAVSEESGADGSSATAGEGATVQKSVFVRVEEKIIKESSLIRDGHGEGVDDVLPAIVNKDVVVDESKIIQVVGGEAPLEETAPADGSAREGEEENEEEEGPPVEEGAEKSSGGTGDPSVAEAEPPRVARPAKTMEPSLPSVEVIQNPKPVVMMSIKEEVFLGTGKKLGVEVAEAPWKANRMVAEMREKGVMDRMVVEMREKRFSGNAQVVILVSTVFFTTLLAILLHHYGGRLLESTLV